MMSDQKDWAAAYDPGSDLFVINSVRPETAEKTRAKHPGYSHVHLMDSTKIEEWIKETCPKKLDTSCWAGRDAYEAPAGWMDWKEVIG